MQISFSQKRIVPRAEYLYILHSSARICLYGVYDTVVVRMALMGIFKQHGQGFPNTGGEVFPLQAADDRPRPADALFLFRFRKLAGHIRRLRAGAYGIGEGVDEKEAAPFKKRQGFLKLLLRLPGKAADEVGGEAAPGEMLSQKVAAFTEPGGIVLSPHTGKGLVAAGLEGQVKMRAEISQGRKLLAKILRHHRRLQGA